MGKLRDRMEQDLILKGLAATTRRNYLLYCRKFAAHFGRSPEELGEAEIRAFLMHLIQVEQVSYATYRQVLAALKFLYRTTLGREWEVNRVPFPRHRQARLPCVLRDDQLRALFAALKSPKYRALFMTCYGAGLRIGEACRLQVGDIDSRRMVNARPEIHEEKGLAVGTCRSSGTLWCHRDRGYLRRSVPTDSQLLRTARRVRSYGSWRVTINRLSTSLLLFLLLSIVIQFWMSEPSSGHRLPPDANEYH